MIISLPIHGPNRDPLIDLSDRHLKHTFVGPVYSKRRMAIILFMYDRDMFCLPLYTYGGTGLIKKQDYIHEFASVMNVGDQNFVNKGNYDPIPVKCGRPLDANTSVHLAGGLTVNYCEDTKIVGEIAQPVHDSLLHLWLRLATAAQTERW